MKTDEIWCKPMNIRNWSMRVDELWWNQIDFNEILMKLNEGLKMDDNQYNSMEIDELSEYPISRSEISKPARL